MWITQYNFSSGTKERQFDQTDNLHFRAAQVLILEREKNMAILVSVFHLQAGPKVKNPTPFRQRMCLNHCFQFPPFKLFLRTCQTQQMGQKGTDSFSVHRSEQDEKKLQVGSAY